MKTTKAQAARATRIATHYAGLCAKPMASSAKLAAEDAATCVSKGDFGCAVKRALTSLSYSVGVLSPIYTDAKASIAAR